MNALSILSAFCVAFGLSASAAPGVVAQSHAWQLERYAGPMHKGGAIAAATQSAGSEDGARLQAVLRCWSATREIDIRFVLGDGASITSDEVRWQFDRRRTRTGRWRLSSDRGAVVVPSAAAREIARSMSAAKQLTLWITAERELTYHISLQGSARAIAALEMHCSL